MNEALDTLINFWLAEDIGEGDHSTLSCIPESAIGKSQLLVKENGMIAGIEIALQLLKKFDSNLIISTYFSDGDFVKVGDCVFVVEGKVHSLLQTERLLLNIMQRMSGIATRTNEYVKLLDGTKARILDTRKTTPGLRLLEKQAVKIGGGHNHRIGLYDMIMLKDNHVDFAGGIQQAIEQANNYLTQTNKQLQIEIEVRNFEELGLVLQHGGVNRIMLDNFSIGNTRKAVEMIGGRFETEASGGITYETIRQYALCGVDYISVGALTHSVRSLDLSFKAL